MNFVDVIKKSVVNQFTGTISVQSIILSLLTAFVISLFILWIYKKTYPLWCSKNSSRTWQKIRDNFAR